MRNNRSVILKFRVTPEESEQIARLADALKMTVSEYLRFVTVTPAKKLKQMEVVNAD